MIQLEALPLELDAKYDEVLRRLAPAPGTWVTRNDLMHLRSAYSFPLEFPDLRWMAAAAKLRVIEQLARDCRKKAKDLEALQLHHFRRPFGNWHRRAHFTVLAQLETKLLEKGISRQDVRMISENEPISFQAAARAHDQTQIRRGLLRRITATSKNDTLEAARRSRYTGEACAVEFQDVAGMVPASCDGRLLSRSLQRLGNFAPHAHDATSTKHKRVQALPHERGQHRTLFTL